MRFGLPSFEYEVQEVVGPVATAGAFRRASIPAGGPSAVRPRWPRSIDFALLFLAALTAICINGYHPCGEDAGIYVAGIKQVLHPGIYGTSSGFISPYFRWSIFPQFNAQIVRMLHLPLPYALFCLQILTTWLLVYALWGLAKRCFEIVQEQWAALVVTVVCLSVPVAGSSIYLMDPYLTGRSYSTPLALLAIAACLDQKGARTVAFLLLAVLFHPLMGIYATGFVLLLWAVNRGSWTGVTCLVAAAIGIAAVIAYSQRHVVESPEYLAAVTTRGYYFLSRWQWYEQFGLIAPLFLLAIFLLARKASASPRAVILAKTCFGAGCLSIAICLIFAKPSSHSHLISALQAIRMFLWVYISMFLLLGGVIGRSWLKTKPLRWILFILAAGSGMTFLQHLAYPASAHVELPWVANSNGWNRAFLWIKTSTPHDAVFALDADYMHIPGEDAQGFRAIAERSSLADLSKDGGAAAAFPELANPWWTEHTATTGLNKIDDAERLRRLAPFHVDWIVLTAAAPTNLACPFADDLAKVCRLR